MSKKHVRFHTLLETKLNKSLEKFLKEELTPGVIRKIRDEIKDQISGVFEASNHRLSAFAKIWLTDQYFKAIKVNDEQSMSDLVVINEYTLPELEFDDVKLLHDLFLPTTMGPRLVEELKRRKDLMS